MKSINIIAQCCFFSGLALKLFHLHYNAILMLIGLTGMLVFLIIGLLRNKNKYTFPLNLANFAWSLLIFLCAKFLPMQGSVLIAAVLLTLLGSILVISAGKGRKIVFLILPMSIAIYFFILPSHERYKLLSINWNYEIERDYISWDKYSWFLYQNGEFSKALQASDKARKIANKLGDSHWENSIEGHYRSIKRKNWEKYR